MLLHKNLESFNEKASVVTIGTFDGVHLAHKQIVQRVIQLSKEDGLSSVVLTFWPHPRKVIEGASETPQLLTSLPEKIKAFELLKLDHLIVTPFTREFSELEPELFIEEILVKKLRTKKIIIGYDHRFGKNRTGSFQLLQKLSPQFGYSVEEISKQMLEKSDISSTTIRKQLQVGKVKEAGELLGRNYSLSGLVVKGKQLGRTIGFPTANIQPDDGEKLIPFDGVYAVSVLYNGKNYNGMMNIGDRPTVNGKERTIEVNIFDFQTDIYGEKLQIEFIDRIRDQKKFNGLEELKMQLREDQKTAQKILLLQNVN
jgi:riboflavin kinase/FMN adenylyltransferase